MKKRRESNQKDGRVKKIHAGGKQMIGANDLEQGNQVVRVSKT